MSMQKWLLVFCIAFFTTAQAHAQWQRGALRGLKKPPVNPRAIQAPAIQRAINQAIKDKTSSLLHSTCILRLNRENVSTFSSLEYFLDASAFIFEEKYKGKTYLWGATASHYDLSKSFLEDAQTGEKIPVQILAQGHAGRNDVALFLIPAQLKTQFKPLELATHSPQKGENLHSAGYFDEGFHVEENRVVTEVLPARILTSLKVGDQLAREGACGGPVLNEKGELVGMHVGSSSKEQVGFIVPVENIYELLQAYHNNGKALRPFYFKGRQIGNININEFIRYIEVWQGNKKLEDFPASPSRAYLDYEHLEKFVDASHADKIVFVIEREPFSMLEKDQNTYHFNITYDLHTFHISQSLPKKIQY